MQKVKDKPKRNRRKNIPTLRIIQFTAEDARENAKGQLSQGQEPRLYKAMNKHLIHPILYPLLIFLLLPVAYLLPETDLSRIVWIVFVLIGLFTVNEIEKYFVLKDIHITSFVGTANPYQDDTGWYIQFDDVMKFEIKDQLNKLFRDGKKYRVFMTQKDNIILSAREVNEK